VNRETEIGVRSRSAGWQRARRILVSGLVANLVVACATSPDETGTLKSLEREQVTIERGAAIAASREAAMRAYQQFLAAAPRDTLRPEAMRRLGDLALEGDRSGDGPKQAEYREAINTYRQLLRGYPRFAGNDRVMYQLAHAYEQSGDLKSSLATLDELVARYPNSGHRDEAEFRRGELLFTLREYPQAEQAYRTVLSHPESPFYERALYMRGWSAFKQAKLDPALRSFFQVLDRKLGAPAGAAPPTMTDLSRADRELTEDTFRVVSLSLANLKGAESIPVYTKAPGRRAYEHYVYAELAGLYEKQERVKDAADTLNSFARRYPTDPHAPLMQARVIDMYQKANFATLALEAKKEYVERYGVDSAFRRANTAEAYAPVMKLVQTHLRDLARHYHAAAQKSKHSADYQQAAHWYRTYLHSFPDDPQAPAMNFLLAELLFEDKHYLEAIVEYEKTAYHYPRHAKTAEAGYAALLAYAKQEEQAPAAEKRKYRLAGAESALRFAQVNPKDPRTPRVLTDAAEKFYALNVPERAATAAQRVLAIEPPVAPELRRTAWTVAAHTEFDKGAYVKAESAYQQALALTPANAPARSKLNERLAASIYKQGEQARNAGRLKTAATHFLRVGQVVPSSSIRATAQYDAAAAFIALKDWKDAAPVLEDFHTRFPHHPLQAEVPAKLAAVYLEDGQPAKAAAQFEALAAAKRDPASSRDALWQAAELYEKAGRHQSAAGVYARYVQQHPSPLAPAIEARYRLVQLAEKYGRPSDRQAWAHALVEAEKRGGRSRTDRTRYLGALCALIVAEPLAQAYHRVKLVEPLKDSLKRKKVRMQQLLDAYGVAVDYGVAEVATAATYHTAAVYQDFGKALLKSERPKGLKGEALEEYNVLLEEQAYPFEEKAIKLHEINVSRLRQNIYDEWVKKSIASLGRLVPVRYAKAEKGEAVIHALH
jgi:TolA-binding protein